MTSALLSAGCDALVIPAARRPGGPRAALSEAIRNLTGLPTLVIGVATADEASTLLLGGQADLVMARASVVNSTMAREDHPDG